MNRQNHKERARPGVKNSKISFVFCSWILRPGLALALALAMLTVLLPVPASAATITLNPNADVAGSVNLTPSTAGTHYTLMNDSLDTTWVESNNATTYSTDLYDLDNPDITGKGVIGNIEIHYRAYSDVTPTKASAYTILTLGASTLDTSLSARTITTAITEYTDTYSSRPSGGTWTWLDITNLRAGVALRDAKVGNKRSNCTELWVVVNYTAVTMDSYRDEGTPPTTVWGYDVSHQYDATYGTVYMYGTNWVPSHAYHVAYYDSTNAKLLSNGGIPSGGDNTLNHSYLLSSNPAQPGTWHAVIFDDDFGSPPATYSAGAAGSVYDDTFMVQGDAIPEFPTVMAAIVVAGACFGIYWWMRRKARIKMQIAN